MSSLLGVGCATSGALADGVALGSGKYLVASSISMASSCGPSDPPAPTSAVELLLVDVVNEAVNGLGGYAEIGPVESLTLVARPGGGAWLGFGYTSTAAGGVSRNYRVAAYDADGVPLGDGPSFFTSGPIPTTAPIAYSLAANGGLLAQARVVTPDALPGGLLELMLSADMPCDDGGPKTCALAKSASLSLKTLPGNHVPASAASLAVSPDGQSVLVAFVEGNGTTTEPTMTLARVDCAALE